MPDYLYCTSNHRTPGVIRIARSHDDPRLETHDPALRHKKPCAASIDWVLRVVDCGASERALRNALRRHADPNERGAFRCDPMTARGAAIKLTTLRAGDEKKKRPRSLLKRLFPELCYRRAA